MPRLVMAAWLAVGAAGATQPPDPPASPPGAPPARPQPVRLEDLPVAIRLGARAEAVRRGVPVWPVVVLVRDEAAYVEAIAHWSPKGRFPVLLDDDTQPGHEDIARFVRAFKPERVVRYSPVAGTDTPVEPWPADGAARRARIDTAIARAWGAETPAGLPAKLQEAGLIPPGVVIADPSDPAWLAALAIAAGRGQPIIWDVLPPVSGGVNGEMSAATGEAFASAIENACEQIGLPWRATGDAIDAVAICLNTAVKVRLTADKTVATTDLIGRLRPDGASTRENGARWAWAGQVFGFAGQSAYRAMCGLFLSPRSAWLFDGYPDSAPWSTYDATRAGDPLRASGIQPLIDDTPRQGRDEWLARARRPLEAGLVLINSKGNADFFDLEPGRCSPGDAPILSVPAIVHFVHSWSTAWPGERTTVAARWLERGAYAYAGSVQEPYLQAFVPTPVVAARLVSTFPWGAAVRLDGGPAWRVAVIGDPLITVGPPPPQATGDFPLAGTERLDAGVAPAVKERRFADALRLLVMLGRDSDAADLAAALIAEDGAAVTPEVAAAAIMPLFRAGRDAALLDAFNSLGPAGTFDPALLDALWLAALPRAIGAADEKALTVLRPRLRPGQAGRDAAAIAPTFSARFGRDSALGMLRDARAASTSAPDTEAADAAIQRLQGR